VYVRLRFCQLEKVGQPDRNGMAKRSDLATACAPGSNGRFAMDRISGRVSSSAQLCTPHRRPFVWPYRRLAVQCFAPVYAALPPMLTPGVDAS
jgi:hypothetical protein